MRALNSRELDSVSGGAGLLGNLLGGLFGGFGNNAQSALAPAANTNTIPSANYAPAGYPAAANAPSVNLGGFGGLGQLLGPVQAFTNFLQHPLTSIISLIGEGIQQAVNFVTRLI